MWWVGNYLPILCLKKIVKPRLLVDDTLIYLIQFVKSVPSSLYNQRKNRSINKYTRGGSGPKRL